MAEEDRPDPFAELADWAQRTERRVQSGRRRSVLLRRLPVFLGVLVTLGLLAAATPRVWSALANRYPKSAPPPGVTVTTTESAAPTDPFAGTPAAEYPKGEAGITLPKAGPVAGFTAAQVQAALRQVRQAMIAARLDPSMLTGHDPSRLIALFAPNQRDDVRADFRSVGQGTYATRIDPAVRLDAREQPRVSGRLTYAATTVDGIRTLRVTTNFIWVYAFDGADHPIAAAHDEIQWEFPSTVNLRAGDRGMWMRDVKSYSAWVDCAAADRGFFAPTRTPGPPDPLRTEDPNALLRADHALEIGDDCH